MKKIIMMMMLLIPMISLGQLEVNEKVESVKIGEIRMVGTFYMSITKSPEHDTYFFMYNNLKYVSITDIKGFYLPSTEDFDELYKIIIDNLHENKSLEIQLMNDEVLRLTFAKNKIQFNVWNGVYLSYSAYFNLKQINKLFGKV